MLLVVAGQQVDPEQPERNLQVEVLVLAAVAVVLMYH
jgi:hypothetical protein